MYSKGDIVEHWDEAEYNYFMSLDDMTKVYYLHDYLYGEFEEDVFDGLDIPEETPQHNPIQVIIDSENFIVSCDNPLLIQKTVGLFVLDGFILEKKSEKGNLHVYRIIAVGEPMSVNWHIVIPN